MTDDMVGVQGIGWRLVRPAYSTAGGRNMQAKHAHVMVVGEYAITGMGADDHRTIRYRVERFDSPARAHRHALRYTEHREQTGFLMVTDPTTLPMVKEGARELLEKLEGAGSGPHKGIYDSFAKLFRTGVPLAESLSPAVSPAA